MKLPRLVYAAIGCVAVGYAIVLTWFVGPLNAFWSTDQGVKLIQTQSLILTKFQTAAVVNPSTSLDPAGNATPLRGQYLVRGQQTYAMFPIAFAAITAPLLFIFGYPGLYILPFASGIGVAAVTALLGQQLLKPATQAALVLLVGFGSPVAFYSVTFWEHAPATLCVTLALVAVVHAQQRQKRLPLVFAGTLIAAATWLRNETALCFLALGVALIFYEKRVVVTDLLAIGSGFAIGVVPLMLFNLQTYGNALGAHVLVAGANERLSLAAWANLLLIPLNRPANHIILASLILLALVRLLWPKLLPTQIQYVGSVVLLALIALLNPVTHETVSSLLLACPAVVLWLLVGPPDTAHPPAIVRFCVIFALTFIMACWFVRLPDGGAQQGPRMLLPAIPALLVAGVWSAERWLMSAKSNLQVGMLVMSLTLLGQNALNTQVSSIQQLAYTTTRNHVVLTTAAQSQAHVIITDHWIGPPLDAPLFYDGHLVFITDNPTDLDILLTHLIQHNEQRFYYIGTFYQPKMAAPQLNAFEPTGPRTQFPHRLQGQLFVYRH